MARCLRLRQDLGRVRLVCRVRVHGVAGLRFPHIVFGCLVGIRGLGYDIRGDEEVREEGEALAAEFVLRE